MAVDKKGNWTGTGTGKWYVVSLWSCAHSRDEIEALLHTKTQLLYVQRHNLVWLCGQATLPSTIKQDVFWMKPGMGPSHMTLLCVH